MGEGALLSLSGIWREVGWGGVGWALIRGVYGCLFEVGANSRLGAFRINTVDIIYYFGPNLKSREKKYIVCHNAQI